MPIKTSLPSIAATLGAVALTACAPAIRSQRDESIPVPQGATWAWAKDAPVGPAGTPEPGAEAPPAPRGRARWPGDDPTAARAIPQQRFHRALETAMEAKGFRQVADRTEAGFLLALAIEGPARRPRAGVVTGIGVGWGRRPWGWYRPWAGWVSWGNWLWSPWGLGWYGVPYWGVAAYPVYQIPGRSLTIVAVLRQRGSGEVAWRAQYRADAYDLAYLTQRHAQDIADKLVASLR